MEFSDNSSVAELQFRNLASELLNSKKPVVFLGALNFEECSIAFMTELLNAKFLTELRWSFNKIRLVSKRASP